LITVKISAFLPEARSSELAGFGIQTSMAWLHILGLLIFFTRLAISGFAQGYPPLEAASNMTVSSDCEVTLVASEPLVRQPVAIDFDDRGRLWVIQYLQYPNPAGLKRARVDRWSRTAYDRVPEPPPHGPRGADRLTILEDTNGDGRADHAKDFVSGLNLATGFAFGHGGVFVLQVPYLLFYPDYNADDLPDGDPVVCLSGFGMDDAHSVANSLTWGPDGWFYGCQGSTVTSHIRGIEFQQGIWRFHPLTHEFELFCEGGGNSWGLDFDTDGELIYSTNAGPYRMLHARQGAYYWKSFGKHGALHNPYAFGYFDHVAHTNFQGGHVTVGGIVYHGTNLPARFLGKYVAGDLLGHSVQWHHLYRHSSTFTSSHGGDLLRANDTWFATSDVTIGPDNAIYVADWHDQRTAHPDPDAEWDRGNGRIYRIAAKDAGPAVLPRFKELSSPQLVALLGNRNPWIVRKARQTLASRRNPEVILPLRTLILESSVFHSGARASPEPKPPGARTALSASSEPPAPDRADKAVRAPSGSFMEIEKDRIALEALWALHVSGGFNEAFAARTLTHRNPIIRNWTIRLMGDERTISRNFSQQLAQLAESESDVRVCAQLACTAQRLSARDGLPIALALLSRNLDPDDPHLPLLIWWAIERHALGAIENLTQFFSAPSSRHNDIAREFVVTRLLRRWVAEGSDATFDACASVIASAPASERPRLFAAVEQGFRDRPQEPVNFGSGGLFANSAAAALDRKKRFTGPQRMSAALAREFEAVWRDDTNDPALIRLACRLGWNAGQARALFLAADQTSQPALRVQMIQCLGELGRAEDGESILRIAGSNSPESVRLAALDALPSFSGSGIADHLLDVYSAFTGRLRHHCVGILLSRKDWARALLRAVDLGKVTPDAIHVSDLRRIALHSDVMLDALVRKHWGNIAAGTAEEKLAEMRRLNNDLRAGRGDPARGRVVFNRICASCHVFNGEGGKIGPDLTHANRADSEFLLASIVDPSAIIRKEYLNYEIETADGRLLSGLIGEQSAGIITIISAAGERTTLQPDRIKEVRESALSAMPEGLLQTLRPQELRDLFSYLQSSSLTKP
jgi:putative membrane-bound dehydrogenase-like protein